MSRRLRSACLAAPFAILLGLLVGPWTPRARTQYGHHPMAFHPAMQGGVHPAVYQMALLRQQLMQLHQARQAALMHMLHQQRLAALQAAQQRLQQQQLARMHMPRQQGPYLPGGPHHTAGHHPGGGGQWPVAHQGFPRPFAPGAPWGFPGGHGSPALGWGRGAPDHGQHGQHGQHGHPGQPTFPVAYSPGGPRTNPLEQLLNPHHQHSGSGAGTTGGHPGHSSTGNGPHPGTHPGSGSPPSHSPLHALLSPGSGSHPGSVGHHVAQAPANTPPTHPTGSTGHPGHGNSSAAVAPGHTPTHGNSPPSGGSPAHQPATPPGHHAVTVPPTTPSHPAAGTGHNTTPPAQTAPVHTPAPTHVAATPPAHTNPAPATHPAASSGGNQHPSNSIDPLVAALLIGGLKGNGGQAQPPQHAPLSLNPSAGHGSPLLPPQPQGGSSPFLSGLLGNDPNLNRAVDAIAFPGSLGIAPGNVAGQSNAINGALGNYYGSLPPSWLGPNPGAWSNAAIAQQNQGLAAQRIFNGQLGQLTGNPLLGLLGGL